MFPTIHNSRNDLLSISFFLRTFLYVLTFPSQFVPHFLKIETLFLATKLTKRLFLFKNINDACQLMFYLVFQVFRSPSISQLTTATTAHNLQEIQKLATL